MANLLFKTLPVSCAVMAAFAGPAVAAADFRSDDIRVTATRVEKELMDVNMSVDVVTADQIAASPAQTVTDLIRNLPGVELSSRSSQGIKRVQIRGEEPMRTLVLIDGQKVAEQKSMEGSPLSIDPSMIERIEVIKGPASVLYGSAAIGGVINIITKKGGSQPLQGTVSTGFNTANNGVSGAASIYGGDKGWHYRLGAGYEDGGNLKTPEGRMAHTDFRSKAANGFLSYDLTEDSTVGLLFDHFDLDDNGTNSQYVKRGKVFETTLPEWKRDKVGIFAETRHVNDTLERVRADVFVQKTKKDFGNRIELMPTKELNVKADNKQTMTGASLQADWALNDANYLVTGVEYEHESLKAHTRTLMPSMAPGMPEMGTREFNKGTADTYAVFGALETALSDTVTLNTGARYTYAATNMKISDKQPIKTPAAGGGAGHGAAGGHPGTGTGGHPGTGAGEHPGAGAGGHPGAGGGMPPGVKPLPEPDYVGKAHKSRVVFNAGLLWRAQDDLTLRANWSQGFRMPLLAERNMSMRMGQSGDKTFGNPALKPETSDNFEVGARYLTDRWTLDTAVFYNHANHYIDRVLLQKGQNHGPSTYQWQNIGKADTVGMSVEAAYRIAGTGFEPYADLTWMHRKVKADHFSTTDSLAPALSATYGVRWHGAVKGMTVSTDAFAISHTRAEQPTFALGTQDDDNTVDAWTTFNLAGTVAFGPHDRYSVSAGLYNVFNKSYQVQPYGIEPERHMTVKFNAAF